MFPTKKYKNSPLIEVICEFKFVNSGKTIEEIETLFGSVIKDDYPERTEKNNITLDIKPNELPSEKSFAKQIGFIQYKNSRQNRLVQFGENILAINQLKPYIGWEEFSPIILENLALYKKLIGFEKLLQVKLRYINRIEIPSTEESISDYFKYSLQVPNELSKDLASIRLSSEHFCQNARDVLVVSLYNTPPANNTSTDFVFDLNYVLIDNTKIDNQEIEKWLNDAHESINTIFEASLTEKCKLLFD